MRCTVGWASLRNAGVAVLLVGIIGVAACERGSSPATDVSPGPAKELTILTPHGDAIRDAFTQGFWNWHLTNRGAPVRINWIYRGAPQCVEYVRSGMEMRAAGAPYTNPDVVFGGGIADHARLADEGFSRALDLGNALAAIPPDIRGQATRDPQGRWCATGLSSFGILYNERACGDRGIAPPTTWTDLGDPRFYGWVALADPVASGSHRECLELILQQQGWAEGWRTILRILGNTRALHARSADAIRQVDIGAALVTFAVNFDGMAAAAESGGALKYIDPPEASAVSLDIISVLTGAHDVELAKDFVRYVLSEEGQALWAVRRAHTDPHGPSLYHYAILPSVYQKYADQLAVQRDPLQTDFGLRLDVGAARSQMLVGLVQAACSEGNHIRLQLTWRKLIDAGLPRDAVAELTAPLFEEPTSAPASQPKEAAAAEAEKLRSERAAKYAERYARVLKMIKS